METLSLAVLQEATGRGHRRCGKPIGYTADEVYVVKTYSFKVVIEPDEDAEGDPAWHAYCPALVSIGAATSGRTREEALKNINEVVRMIVQESIEEGTQLPEGPADSVDVVEISQEEPRIAVTV
jgi:predicted RNase H-like HicB family nuclease